MNDNIEVGNWVLFPQTKDNKDNPNIVAKVISIDTNIVNVSISGQSLPIPKTWCRVVSVILN